ncbi:MAG: PAS domain S-box protein [Candidatus Acidiferrales bacterium]
MAENPATDSTPASKPLRLLIAEDNPADLDLTVRALKKSDIALEIETVSAREEFVSKLNAKPFDIVLSDYRMPGWTGVDALTEIVKLGQDIPLILVTGTLGDGKAVECIKLGITDYVLKDQLARLPMAILRAHEEKALRDAEKRAVGAVRESEARFRTLVENAPEAIVVLDVEKGLFVDCNDNALRLFRLTRDELLRHGPGELSPPFQPDGRHSAIASVEWMDGASGNIIPHFEWTHRNSLGDEIPCEVHLVRLPSPTRQLIRGSILDITERKRAEEALRESEVRYRGLVNNATYGIYWVTMDGFFLDANPALVRMLGYESIDALLLLRDTSNLFCDPTQRESIRSGFRENDRSDATADWKRRDGKIITVRLIARRSRDHQRNTDCTEVIVEDVTERLAL